MDNALMFGPSTDYLPPEEAERRVREYMANFLSPGSFGDYLEGAAPYLAAIGGAAYLGGAFGGAGAAGGGAGVGAGAAGGGLTAPAGYTLAPSLGAGATGAGAAGAAGGGGWGAFLGSPSFWGPAVGAGIGLYGQSQAIRSSERGNQQQIDLLNSINQQNRADNAPLLALRNQTLPQINALMQNPSSITSQPDYQFGLSEGNRQIGNRQAASGNYYSGGAMREAQRYGQDYAGSKLTDSLNRLMGVAGLGQVGATQQQQSNTNFGNQAGNALMQQGNIRGSGYMGMTNTVGGAVNDWFNNWQRGQFGGP